MPCEESLVQGRIIIVFLYHFLFYYSRHINQKMVADVRVMTFAENVTKTVGHSIYFGYSYYTMIRSCAVILTLGK